MMNQVKNRTFKPKDRKDESTAKVDWHADAEVDKAVQDEYNEKMLLIMDAVTAMISYRGHVDATVIATMFDEPLLIINNILVHYNLQKRRNQDIWVWKRIRVIKNAN